MEIVLTKDINPEKGWVEGAIIDLPRPTLTMLEEQFEGRDWYTFSNHLTSLFNRQQVGAKKKPGRPRKADVEEVK
jgi:hypothetical protein